MAVHDGLLLDSIIGVVEEIQVVLSAIPEFPDTTLPLATSAAGVRANTAVAIGGMLDPMSFADGPLLDRVYFLPRSVDGGFIVQDTEQDIMVWNAHESQSYEISAIAATAPDGTDLDHPATPITITPETNLIHVLSLFRQGPPFQDTQYTYNISPWTFTLLVFGRRIEAFLYDPDWATPVKIGYVFSTILDRSRRYVEQRRPLFEIVKRKPAAAFWFDETEAQYFLNDIKRFHAKVLGVPIWSEPMHPTTSPLQGSTFAIVSEAVVDYFNLRNTTIFVLLKDTENKDLNEIKELAALDTGLRKLTFTNQISADLQQAQTVIYPIALALIGDLSTEYLTDDLVKCELEFEEFKSA